MDEDAARQGEQLVALRWEAEAAEPSATDGNEDGDGARA
jgi:hypothetical protein